MNGYEVVWHGALHRTWVPRLATAAPAPVPAVRRSSRTRQRWPLVLAALKRQGGWMTPQAVQGVTGLSASCVCTSLHRLHRDGRVARWDAPPRGVGRPQTLYRCAEFANPE